MKLMTDTIQYVYHNSSITAKNRIIFSFHPFCDDIGVFLEGTNYDSMIDILNNKLNILVCGSRLINKR